MRYSSSVFTVAKVRSHATKWYKRRLCRFHRFRDILSSISGIPNADLYDFLNSTPVRTIVRTANKNKDISRSGLCASGQISPERWEIFEFRFHFRVGQELRYQRVQTTSLLLLSFQRYYSRHNHEFRMLTYSSVVNRKSRSRTIVRERLNKEISRSGLCASGQISPERWEIFELRFHFRVGQELRYQRVQTTSL